ncbi:GPI inositol-deacylase [Meyerozyma sp. JA9]|nr:GPI inositol-deacylase [Meyerozyma sp. JA9]
MARSRYARIYSQGIAVVGIVIFMLTAHLFTQTLEGADSPGCRQVFMGPSYARIRAFDESHTKFASKYSLYLYREQGKDPLPDSDNAAGFLDGIPALFIPGNAGSYRQVRSIAAETSNLYFDENVGVKNYDFFSAEFNEDFSAFHGRTLLDQAEFLNEAIKYILYLYSSKPNPPKSVLLLGHSMGGIVARVMLTLPNYVEDSVQTIVTLASPHAAAPLTTDGDILRIYSAIDRFWYEGYHLPNDSIQNKRLSNVTLISITGGLLDNTLPADYTSLGFLVPESHGFTVYTTGIRDVWTPVDHLAIVWCSQLRTQVSRMLLEFADDKVPTKQKPLQERMKIARTRLLTGFEDVCNQDRNIRHTSSDRAIQLVVDDSQVKFLQSHEQLRISEQSSTLIHAFDLSDQTSFNLVSSNIQSWNKFAETRHHVSVLLCNKNSKEVATSKVFVLGDQDSSRKLTYVCYDAKEDVLSIPNSKASTLRETSSGGKKQPFHAIRYNGKDLAPYQYAFIFSGDAENFVVADVQPDLELVASESLSSLILGDTHIEIPSERPLITNIKVRGAWSSILAYRLSFDGYRGENDPFAPLLRQWKSNPYETKWHLQPNNVLLTVHGVAPFTPFKYDMKNHDQGLNLELWSVSEPGQQRLRLTLKVDIISSLRLLVLRYRLAIIAFCVAITLAIFAIQMNSLLQSKSVPSFSYALSELTSPKIFGLCCLFLSILTPVARICAVQKILDMVDPVVLQDRNEVNMSLHAEFKLNSYYLGLEETSLWFVGPLFYIIGVGIVSLTYWIIYGAATILSFIVQRFFQKPRKTETNDKEAIEVVSYDRNKILLFFAACICTSIYLPYQLAYVVCCIIQAVVVVKLNCTGNRSLINYHTTILLLMIWVLPINIPVIIVFVHNISVDWTTPFSSHHNFLAILPIMLVVGRHANRNYLPKFEKGSIGLKVFYGYIGYFTLYCLVYGIRHTYWIHHLLNLMFCILLIHEVEPDK